MTPYCCVLHHTILTVDLASKVNKDVLLDSPRSVQFGFANFSSKEGKQAHGGWPGTKSQINCWDCMVPYWCVLHQNQGKQAQ